MGTLSSMKALVPSEAILAGGMMGQKVSSVMHDPVHGWVIDRDGPTNLVPEGKFDCDRLILNHLDGAL